MQVFVMQVSRILFLSRAAEAAGFRRMNDVFKGPYSYCFLVN